MMSERMIVLDGKADEPERFQRYYVSDIDGHYSVTVFVGEGFAWCTCRDYWRGQHNSRDRKQYPQAYYGATVSHGCDHIDYVIDKHGYVDEPFDGDAVSDSMRLDALDQRLGELERVVAELRVGRDALLDSIYGHTYVISGSATW